MEWVQKGYGTDTEQIPNGYRTDTEWEWERVWNGNRKRSVKRSVLGFSDWYCTYMQ